MSVYVMNKSSHDFSDATRFGDLRFLTEGRVKQLNVNTIFREIEEHLAKSHPDDYLLVTGLPILNIIACSIFARMHNRLNLLIFKNGKYLERNVVFN